MSKTKKSVGASATIRSRRRYRRAADVVGGVTLDASQASAFAAVLEVTGELRAACVRRLIVEEWQRINKEQEK